MAHTEYKSQKFLFPILSLVIFSILSVASMSAYFATTLFEAHMSEHIEESTNNYTQKHKESVKHEVQFVNDTIQFEIEKIEKTLKASLKEKIEIALKIATFTYDTYKDNHTKEEIKEKIAKALEAIKYSSEHNYYFMYDNKTKVIFGHPMQTFFGKDMTHFKDARGENIIETDAAILAKEKIVFNTIYFTKPENQKEQFPKITCIAKFEPLDVVIGIGEYLDVVEKATKKSVIEMLSGPMHNEKDNYLTILEVHNLEGGDEFATVLLNPNRKELVGTKVSDKGEDARGKRFRKEFLELAKGEGEGYSDYWYKKPSTGIEALKVSYVKFQKEWNWIILSGFYYEDLEKEIALMQEKITFQTHKMQQQTLILVLLLSFLAVAVAIAVSIKIDKTIKRYTDKIIDFEDNKRKQEAVLFEQSKLASMGEMMSNIAHQWRQPLATISMGANNIMLDIDLDAVNMQNLRDGAKEIAEQTIHLSKTIDDFRNFIKGEREKKRFSLNETLNDFIQLVKGSIKSNNITMVLELQNGIEMVGYDNELIQCWINIYHNAKDALIENATEKRCIFITTLVEDKKVIIKIKDNGGGIPEDILPKIFEPYFTTKFKSQGTGLGLYMTHKLIVEGMGGVIEAGNVHYTYEGEEYEGAQFTMTLPLGETSPISHG